MFKFKKKKIVENQNLKEVDTLEVWSVTWKSHYGELSFEIETYKEFFTSKEDAEIFQKSLKDAAKLLRYCHDDIILKKENE